MSEPLFLSVEDKGVINGGITTALLQDNNGFLWVGTQEGLVRYDGYQFIPLLHDKSDPQSFGGSYVRSLAMAPNGDIWVGTLSHGVSIYDPKGRVFSHISQANYPELGNNRFDAVALESSNVAWLGSNAGLYRFDIARQTLTAYPSDGNSDGTSDPHTRALLIDRKGDLWVGTWNGIDHKAKGEQIFRSLFNGRTNVKSAEHPSLASQGLRNKKVLRLFEAENGYIWFGTAGHGGGWINPETMELHWLPLAATKDTPTPLSHPWVTGIAQANKQEIWMATYGGGINVIQAQTGEILRHIRHQSGMAGTLASDEIGPMLTDQSGLLWVGTWGRGLNQYNTQNRGFTLYRASISNPKSLSQGNIYAVMEAQDGRWWLGTGSKGIDIFDPKTGLVQQITQTPLGTGATAGLADLSITAIVQSQSQNQRPGQSVKGATNPSNSIWVGTRQAGFHQLNPKGEVLAHYDKTSGLLNNLVHLLLPSVDGNLWVGTSGGLNYLDVEHQKLHTLSTRDNPEQPFTEQIDALQLAEDGTLWVGAENALYVLSKGQRHLIPIVHDPKRSDSIAGNDVNGLLLDQDQRLWVSTATSLDRLISWEGTSASFESISAKAQMQEEHIGSNLLQDNQGRIWLSSQVVLDPKTLAYQVYRQIDGVDLGASWSRSYTKTRSGHLLFGGTQGLLKIDPSRAKPWRHDVSVTITDLRIDERSQALSSTLNLAPGVRSFSVEFAAMDFSAPAKNQYQYRLTPFNREWIRTDGKRRVATYTNLDPGHYQLQVKGSDRNGNWGSKQLLLDIRQQPHWYQTWWFRLLMVVIGLALIYGLYQLRVRRLLKAELVLQQMVQARTAELQAAHADLSEQKKQLEIALNQVQEASLSDPLTGLRNRRYLLQHIEDDIALVNRAYSQSSGEINTQKSAAKDEAPENKAPENKAPENKALVLFLFDLDKFKSVNDTNGHGAGDKVLVQFAQLLQQSFRESDTIIRWGGEEFLCISRFCNPEIGPTLAEKVRAKIATTSFDIGNNRNLNLTCSIGFAAYPFPLAVNAKGPTSLSWEDVVDIADAALYASKRSGRNGWIGLAPGPNITPQTMTRLRESAAQVVGTGEDAELEVVAADKPVESLVWQ